VSWLIDTNILSELRKGSRADNRVRAWFDATAEAELFTSVLVLGEIRRGVELIRRRDSTAAETLERWMKLLPDHFAGRLLPIDSAVAECWGALNVPNPIPTIDGLLAATAIVHDLVLATRNTADISRTGVRYFNPFEGSPSAQ